MRAVSSNTAGFLTGTSWRGWLSGISSNRPGSARSGVSRIVRRLYHAFKVPLGAALPMNPGLWGQPPGAHVDIPGKSTRDSRSDAATARRTSVSGTVAPPLPAGARVAPKEAPPTHHADDLELVKGGQRGACARRTHTDREEHTHEREESPPSCDVSCGFACALGCISAPTATSRHAWSLCAGRVYVAWCTLLAGSSLTALHWGLAGAIGVSSRRVSAPTNEGSTWT